MTEWRDIPCAPGYQASADGQIRRIRLCKNGWKPRVLAGYVNPIGYRVVTISPGRVRALHFVHRLVCLAFHGPRPSTGHEVAHGDGNALNNAATNLRWATVAENAADRKLHGRDTVGERHGMAKLTAVDAASVRQLAHNGMKQRDIGRRFGIHQAQVHRIVTGKSWRHLFAAPRAREAA